MESIKKKSLIQSLALNAVVAVTARRFVLSPALSCFCHGKVYTHMFMCTVYVCYVCMYVHTHTHTHTHTQLIIHSVPGCTELDLQWTFGNPTIAYTWVHCSASCFDKTIVMILHEHVSYY